MTHGFDEMLFFFVLRVVMTRKTLFLKPHPAQVIEQWFNLIYTYDLAHWLWLFSLAL